MASLASRTYVPMPQGPDNTEAAPSRFKSEMIKSLYVLPFALPAGGQSSAAEAAQPSLRLLPSCGPIRAGTWPLKGTRPGRITALVNSPCSGLRVFRNG